MLFYLLFLISLLLFNKTSYCQTTVINYGLISTLAGNYAKKDTYSGDGGSALQAGLDHPTCTVVDQANNLVYITDVSTPGRVRVVDVKLNVINLVAGGGTCFLGLW